MCGIEPASGLDPYPEFIYDPGPMSGNARQDFGRWNENQQEKREEDQVEDDFFPTCQHKFTGK